MVDHSGDADLLTAAEERELAYRIEVGALAWAERQAALRRSDATVEELLALEQAGRQARQRFVQANLGLVAGLVRACAARTGLPRDELFQEGCLGLMIAVTRFDHRRGLRFSTYAVPWIRARLGEAVQRRGSGPALPAAGVGRLRAARAAEDELVQALGRDATPAEVAARAGLDQRGYERLLAWQRIGSLDDGDEPARLADAGPAPEEVADESEWTADRLLWHLAPVERDVLRQRYGLPGGEPTRNGPAGEGATTDEPVTEGAATSFTAIARRLGVSVSSVRRIEARALRRLREVCAGGAGRMTA
ncbi:sigma-70 family RNA polymerase sigma factor [Microlunatus speluncae]|uniref:sigma-70 family RNA polymerase sigma factor n=1 Tax=Microlunatus speluncae TaxID=2594267 RepID=UPI0012664D71|nr:sigma-70 family RNA polymerase sigma factor [Microlunatus speluncae]